MSRYHCEFNITKYESDCTEKSDFLNLELDTTLHNTAGHGYLPNNIGDAKVFNKKNLSTAVSFKLNIKTWVNIW